MASDQAGPDEPVQEFTLLGLPRTRLDAVSEALFSAGAIGLQEDWLPGQTPVPPQPWDTGARPPEPDHIVLRAFFERPDRAHVEHRAARAGGVGGRWTQVPIVDWEAEFRAAHPPIEIGRIRIAPPWCAGKGDIVVDPGQGFGTGSHATTAQALAAIDALADGLSTLLDVGCGSGILALAGARLGLRVRGIDVEAPAVREAIRNASASGLDGQFSTESLDQVPGRFDLVVANLHAELIERLAAGLIGATGQWLVIAGVLADREAIARSALDPHLRLVHREVDGEWVSLRYRR